MNEKEVLKRIQKASMTGQNHLELYCDVLPPEIGTLTNLTSLDIMFSEIISLPADIKNLKNLTTIALCGKYSTSLPSEITELKNLTTLFLGNRLKSLPPEIGELKKLTTLFLGSNRLKSLPLDICNLTNLTELNIWDNELLSLSPEIGTLTNLNKLYLHQNQLTSLPPEIGELTNLTELTLNLNQLISLPAEIGKLMKLTYLNLCDNQLTSLPPEIGRLKNLTMLYLYNNPMMSEIEDTNKNSFEDIGINEDLLKLIQHEMKEPRHLNENNFPESLLEIPQSKLKRNYYELATSINMLLGCEYDITDKPRGEFKKYIDEEITNNPDQLKLIASIVQKGISISNELDIPLHDIHPLFLTIKDSFDNYYEGLGIAFNYSTQTQQKSKKLKSKKSKHKIIKERVVELLTKKGFRVQTEFQLPQDSDEFTLQNAIRWQFYNEKHKAEIVFRDRQGKKIRIDAVGIFNCPILEHDYHTILNRTIAIEIARETAGSSFNKDIRKLRSLPIPLKIILTNTHGFLNGDIHAVSSIEMLDELISRFIESNPCKDDKGKVSIRPPAVIDKLIESLEEPVIIPDEELIPWLKEIGLDLPEPDIEKKRFRPYCIKEMTRMEDLLKAPIRIFPTKEGKWIIDSKTIDSLFHEGTLGGEWSQENVDAIRKAFREHTLSRLIARQWNHYERQLKEKAHAEGKEYRHDDHRFDFNYKLLCMLKKVGR